MDCDCPNCTARLMGLTSVSPESSLRDWWEVIEDAREIRRRFGNLSREESCRLSDEELENLVEANAFAAEILATEDAYVDASYDYFGRVREEHHEWQWFGDEGPAVVEFEAIEAQWEAEYQAATNYEEPRDWDFADFCTPEEIEGVLERWDTVDALTPERFDDKFVELLAWVRYLIAHHYDEELRYRHSPYWEYDEGLFGWGSIGWSKEEMAELLWEEDSWYWSVRHAKHLARYGGETVEGPI